MRLVAFLFGSCAVFATAHAFGLLERDAACAMSATKPRDEPVEEARPTLIGRAARLVPEETPSTPPAPPQAAPAEEPAEPVVRARRRRPPPDPVETDRARLDLTVLDETTDEPVTTSAQLWRIDAPGNGHWLEGDQLQARIQVKQGKALVEGLPDGMYRLFAEAQRDDTEDPSAFEVRGRWTQIVLRIPMPRRQTITLRVVDVDGRPLESGPAHRWTSCADGHDELWPAWVRWRRLRSEPERDGAPEPFGCCCEGRHEESDAEGTGEGYVLSDLLESARDSVRYHDVSVTPLGRNHVRLDLMGEPVGDARYLGVAIPIETLMRNVHLPDGSIAGADFQEVRAWCEPRRMTAATASDAWRTIPVYVTCVMSGCKRCTFKATAADPSPQVTLEAGS